ncbi:hypothetical protein N8V28_17610 [Enterobacter hormaechei subsp. hoffmannii]|nr:hypothetical protein [Enterobacter hormaechei subsp. hoffmannii]
MAELTKEWIIKAITELEEERDATPGAVNEDAALALAAMKLALASIEVEPVAWLLSGGGAKNNVSFDSGNAYVDPLREVTPLYTAPPAQVAPDEMTPQQASRSYGGEVRGYRDGWNACRAAMLQGADGTLTNEGTIPVTQFKPVADLYEVTVPSGRSTTFTKDAAEASDCRVMGWSVQEYVKLERYQAAMLQGAEPVTTAYKLPFEQWLSQQTGTIDVECGCVMTEVFFHWLRVAYEAGNSPQCREISNSSTNNFRENAETSTKCWCRTCRPVTFADSHFVVCPECGNKRCPHANDHRHACTGSNEPGQEGSAYPAAPQQEVK